MKNTLIVKEKLAALNDIIKSSTTLITKNPLKATFTQSVFMPCTVVNTRIIS